MLTLILPVGLFNGYTDTCFSSIDFSLITFNWFHTIFVDTMPSDVSQFYSLSLSVSVFARLMIILVDYDSNLGHLPV